MADPSPVAAPALLICVEGDDAAAASPVMSPILALKKYARRHRADDDAAASRDEGEPSPLPFVSNALFEERAAFDNVRVGRKPALEDDSDDATSSSSDDDDDLEDEDDGATRRPLGRTTMKLRSQSRAQALAECRRQRWRGHGWFSECAEGGRRPPSAASYFRVLWKFFGS